jgi:transcriptional regulator with XRE-family HTH domain
MRGVKFSHPHLSLLQRGNRTRPSLEVAAALAEFFGIRVSYLIDTERSYVRRLEAELHWLALAHDREPAV